MPTYKFYCSVGCESDGEIYMDDEPAFCPSCGIKYDNPYVRSMRMMMEKQFGELQTEIILWWVFDSISPEGGVYPLMDENKVKHILKTPHQLYKFLKRYDGK